MICSSQPASRQILASNWTSIAEGRTINPG